MPITTFNQEPYFDDYNVEDKNSNDQTVSDKNYLRILFQPGFAVQTRELNQLQSILQNQINRLGSHFFEDGDPIIGENSKPIFTDNVPFVEFTADSNAPTGLANILKLQKSISSNVSNAKILDVTEFKDESGVAKIRLYLNYEQDQSFSSEEGENSLSFKNNQYVNDLAETVSFTGDIGVITAVGVGFSVSVEENVYFINGSFIHFPSTDIFFKKDAQSTTVTGEVRFLITENQINASNDSTLNDNANGSLNFSAPGADRYQIVLKPIFLSSTQAILDSNVNRSDLFSIDEENIGNTKRLLSLGLSLVEQDIDEVNSTFEQKLATRTKETDGNYVLQPFRITYREFYKEAGTGFSNGVYTTGDINDIEPFGVNNDDDAKADFIAEIDTSTAYVNGFRYTYPKKVLLKGDKARSTKTIENKRFTIAYGQVAEFDVNASPSVTLDSDQINNIKSVNKVGDKIQVHVKEGSNFGDNLINSQPSPLIFKMPFRGIKRVEQFEYSFVKKYTGVTKSGSNITIGGLLGDESFDETQNGDESAYGIIDASGNILTASDDYTFVSATGTSITFNVGNANGPFTVFAPVRKDVVTTSEIATKTKTAATPQSFDITGGISQKVTLTTAEKDVYITDTNITVTDQPGATIRVIDTGVRNDRYEAAKIEISGLENGTYTLNYEYFEHSVGEFFTANSYDDLDYCQIPEYEGDSLADFIDFRKKSGVTGKIPRPDSVANIEEALVYVPRVDKLIISDSGDLQLIQGEPDFIPKAPTAPNNSLTLYELFVPYFTCNISDIRNKFIDHSRYTMTQIGDIDQRLQDVETDLLLSNIEKDASSRAFIDEDGIDLFKSGFLVDDFSGHSVGDVTQPDYLVSIDRLNKELRPYYKQRNFKFNYDFPIATNNSDKSKDIATGRIDYNDTSQTYDYNRSDGVVDRESTTRPNELLIRGLPLTTSDSDRNSRNLLLPIRVTLPWINRYERSVGDYPYKIFVWRHLSKAKARASINILINALTEAGATNLSINDFPDEADTGKATIIVQKVGTRDPSTRSGVILYDRNNTHDGEVWIAKNVDYLSDSVDSITLQPLAGVNTRDALTIERYFSKNASQRKVVKQNIRPEVAEKKNQNTDGESSSEILSLWEGQTATLFDQKNISQTLNIQPFEVTTYSGDITLSPSSDEWIDTESRPAVVINNNGAMDAIEFLAENTDVFDGVLGTEWNAWQTNVQSVETTVRNRQTGRFNRGRWWWWFGNQRERITTTTGTLTRTGTQTTLGSDSIEQDLGERVVDINIVPFIRSRYISFRATGLQPGTEHFAFFDGENVSDYCAITPDFIRYSEFSTVRTYNGEGKPNSIGDTDGPLRSTDFNSYEGPLNSTMEQGDLTGVFRIPNNSELRFRTGDRTFKLTSSPSNNDTESESSASATYSASGLLQTKEEQILSTRVPTLIEESVDQTINFSRTTVTPIRRRRDPIAQTFFIDRDNFKDGVFLSDVDIFFAEKPDSNIDVQVYIVPTELGIPTENIIPGSKVIKPQEDVNVSGREPSSNSAIQPTNFKFEYPIHLKSGVEYALVVFSNSTEYRVWTSVLGQRDIRTQNTITTNSNIGVLLKSQNTRTWTPDQTRDLTFKLNRCVFASSKTFTFNTKISDTDLQGVDDFDFDLFNINDSIVKLSNTNVQYNLDFLDQNDITLTNGDFDNVKSKENVTIDSTIADSKNVRATVTLSTQDTNVTPLFDLERFSLIGVNNVVNSSIESDDNGYITKEISILEPASKVRVIFDVNRPDSNSDVDIFVNFDEARSADGKLVYQDAAVVSADNKPATTVPISSDADSFSQVEFEKSISPNEFSKFRIKIVFQSNNSSGISRIKNLSIFALK